MFRSLYIILFTLSLPAILLRLYIKGKKVTGYRENLRERTGRPPFDLKGRRPLWIHAVSVGEVVASASLVEGVQKRWPNWPIVITCMTPTGAETIQRQFGDCVYQCYLPYDHPIFVKRFLNHVNPRLLVVMETELWPTLIYETSKRCPVVVANGRLSERSANRYERFDFLLSYMWHSLSLVLAQFSEDAERFRSRGIPNERVKTVGSLKFDLPIDPNWQMQARDIKSQAPERLTWIAASTHPGEDEDILAAHRVLLKRYPKLLLILVPRHIERADDIARVVGKLGLTSVRRTETPTIPSETQVYLGDTMGELNVMYACADVAFVGGSLVDKGGQNPLEPAANALPILMGPSVHNFREFVNSFKSIQP